VGDGFWRLDGEAEVFGDGCGPFGPGGDAVRAIEGRVDLGAGENAGVAFEVGAGRGNAGGVLLWDAPAGGADFDVCFDMVSVAAALFAVANYQRMVER
jgi:hypothetical protein